MGNRLVEIHNKVLSELRRWNEESRDDVELDFSFGLTLFLSLVPPHQISISNDHHNHDAMVFVLGILKLN